MSDEQKIAKKYFTKYSLKKNLFKLIYGTSAPVSWRYSIISTVHTISTTPSTSSPTNTDAGFSNSRLNLKRKSPKADC